METIESTLQKDRVGTPYKFSSNKKFNDLLRTYALHNDKDLDEDTAYDLSKLIFTHLLRERQMAWVKKNKTKLKKLSNQKRFELFSKHNDLIKKGLANEFPEDMRRVESEYSRRVKAKQKADIASIKRDSIVSRGKAGLINDERDKAMLSNPDYQNPVGSTKNDLDDARQRQSDLSRWKQDGQY